MVWDLRGAKSNVQIWDEAEKWSIKLPKVWLSWTESWDNCCPLSSDQSAFNVDASRAHETAGSNSNEFWDPEIQWFVYHFLKNCGVHQAGQDLMPPTRRDMPPAIWIGMNIHKKDWPYRTLPSYFVWPCLKCGFGRWVSTKNGPFAGSNCWFGGFDVNYSFCAYPSDWWSFGESDTGWITFEHLSSYQ